MLRRTLLGGAALGFILSGFCLITGIYRLIKSMWGLVDRRAASKGLVNAAYERAILAEGPRIVALGGGWSQSALPDVTAQTSAIPPH